MVAPELVIAALVPLAVLGVWWTVRQIRNAHSDHGPPPAKSRYDPFIASVRLARAGGETGRRISSVDRCFHTALAIHAGRRSARSDRAPDRRRRRGAHHQTLKGITGSGKTFTMANIIHRLKRPTLILAPNKTLTSQLYDEMRRFFPENAVEYFVSYYDYFQPEVYLPGRDEFIPKDSSINEHLERLRLSTTKSLIERRDTIVVASVSSIYGMGDPDNYRALQVPLTEGARLGQEELFRSLARLQYDRAEHKLKRGTYRADGDAVEIYPADSEYKALRVGLANGVIASLQWFDAATGKPMESADHYLVSPKTVLAATADQARKAATAILEELETQVERLTSENRLTEAARLYDRITNDAEMLREVGYCSGMENYACYLSGRDPALPPITLLDYLPKDGLLFVDESHVMIPQISAMFRGDQARKDTLIDYGFRLPSSKDSHP
jgi:excinuclease ABC subunit B